MRAQKLENLPDTTFVTDEFGDAWQKRNGTWWCRGTERTDGQMARQTHKVTVVVTPNGAGRQDEVI